MPIARLRDFVAAMTRLVEHQGNAEDAAWNQPAICSRAWSRMTTGCRTPLRPRILRAIGNICCMATRSTASASSALSGVLDSGRRCTTT